MAMSLKPQVLAWQSLGGFVRALLQISLALMIRLSLSTSEAIEQSNVVLYPILLSHDELMLCGIKILFLIEARIIRRKEIARVSPSDVGSHSQKKARPQTSGPL